MPEISLYKATMMVLLMTNLFCFMTQIHQRIQNFPMKNMEGSIYEMDDTECKDRGRPYAKNLRILRRK